MNYLIKCGLLILSISFYSCFKLANTRTNNLSENENCPLPTCVAGKKIVNNEFKVIPNGCGPEATSFQLEVANAMGNSFGKNFKECCNKHDICYGTCGTTKTDCDTEFYNCMKGKCNKKDLKPEELACKVKAKTFYELVKHGSVCYFNNSQIKHCNCA